MSKKFLDRNLALEAVRVTEVAALSSSLHMGRGDEKVADQAAFLAMHRSLQDIDITGNTSYSAVNKTNSASYSDVDVSGNTSYTDVTHAA